MAKLRKQLPAKNNDAIKRAEANVLDGASLGLRYRLVVEQIVGLTFDTMDAKWKAAVDAMEQDALAKGDLE